MTLDEAIRHAEDVADYDCYDDKQRKCSAEHRQLAEWLKELKEFKEFKSGKWKEKEVFVEGEAKAIEEWQSAKCSVCGRYHTTPYLYYFNNYAYCPNCGAKMEESL